MTGPTGPLVTANFLNAINGDNSGVNVANGGILPVTTLNSGGTAISNTNGVISLAPNQTYSVVYQTEPMVPPNATAFAILSLNGSNIVGTGSVFDNRTGAPVRVTFAGNTIISTTQASTLSLTNQSGSAMTFNGTDISVIKIA